MVSITDSSVTIQTSPQSVPSTTSWFGEVAIIAHYPTRQGVLSAIEEHVRFARRRFGHFEVIDFVTVLIGYVISGERTLETFAERQARNAHTKTSPTFRSPCSGCRLFWPLSSIYQPSEGDNG